MSNLSDDDVAANRINHADGSDAGDTPVVYSAALWRTLLSHVAGTINTGSPEYPLYQALVTLCAAV